MDFLAKYGLKLDKDLSLKLIVDCEQNWTKSAKVFRDLLWCLGNRYAYFNIQQLLLFIMEVKYGLRKHYDYFPQSGENSFHITEKIVYLTGNEDDDLNKRKTEAFDKIGIDEFIQFLESIFNVSKQSLNIQNQKLQLTYQRIYHIVDNEWIEYFRLLTIQNNSIILLLGSKKLTFHLFSENDECKIFLRDIIDYQLPQEIFQIKIRNIEGFLRNYINEIRSTNLRS